MDALRITGGIPLHGTVKISGAKNAALPLMTAALLTDKPITFTNVPHLADVSTMAALLGLLGVRASLDGNARGGHVGEVLTLDASAVTDTTAPYDIVRKMRASVLVLGPLLARFGEARVSLPGGCAIGTRPVDLHLKALEQMGAEIALEDGYIHAKSSGRLKGADITFGIVSVGATENLLMAASLADGITTLRNAAREPEVSDLARCLVKMGAKIDGIGSDTLTIEGQTSLHGCEHDIIPDRIETGTYAVAAAITGGRVEIKNTQPALLGAALNALRDAGVSIEATEDNLIVSCDRSALTGIDITTAPHPAFPTDMQAQMMALLTLAKGASVISETIFENRFMHVPELTRMGADIAIHGNVATIRGVEELHGAQVMATDLRASGSLVLAALAAHGTSVIHRVYHLDRGYERFDEKLRLLGAKVERVKE